MKVKKSIADGANRASGGRRPKRRGTGRFRRSRGPVCRMLTACTNRICRKRKHRAFPKADQPVWFDFLVTDSVSGEGIAEAVFEISSRDNLFQTVISDQQGLVRFLLEPCKTYSMRETEAARGYLASKKNYRVDIGACGSVFVDGCHYQRFSIMNTPVITDVSFSVYQGDGTTPLADAVFQLSGGVLAAPLNISSDSWGRVLFSSLRPASYTLREISAPDGFYPDRQSHTVEVDLDGSVRFDEAVDVSAEEFYLVNQPLVTFQLKGREEALPPGVAFQLWQGERLVASDVSDLWGIIVFRALLPGHYRMQLVDTPHGCDMNQAQYDLSIDEHGQVCIDGERIERFTLPNPMFSPLEESVTGEEEDVLQLTQLE